MSSDMKQEQEATVTTRGELFDTNAASTDFLHWWHQPNLRRLYLLMPFLFLGSTTLGYDGSLINGLQTMPAWQSFFNNPTGGSLGIIGAMPGFGGLAVLPFTPYIVDGFGRRAGIAIGCLFVFLGALLQAFPTMPDPTRMYLAGRFFIGVGGTLANGATPLLITEVSHPRHRGRATTIYNTLWYLGAIIAAWVGYGTLVNMSGNIQWRLPTGLQLAMPGLLLLALWFIPESPRYLISKDKDDEALKFLLKYHGDCGQEAFARWEFSEIRETLRMEQLAAANSGWYELVRTPGNRKRCFLIICTAIFSQCSGNGLVSYYLSSILKTIGITDPTNQAAINGGLTIWSFLVSLGFAFAVDKIGRRFLFLFAGVGMLISFTIWTACSAVYAEKGTTGAGSAVLAMIFLFYGAAGLAWPGLTVSYTVEILPYNIRAKGLTLCFVFTQLAGVFNQYVNPIGLEKLAWKFYFVYIVILVIECVVIYFFYVETKGPTLEEIAILFDGDDANVMSEPISAKTQDVQQSHLEVVKS